MKKVMKDLKQFVVRVFALVLMLQFGQAQEIPDRPEKLTFPPLVYDPPKPDDYRTDRKSVV